MSIETSWLADERVLDVRIYDKYRRNDVEEINELVQQALDDHPGQNVYILADCVDMTQILFSPGEMINLFTIFRRDDFGGIIIYGINRSIRAFAELMAQVIKAAAQTNVVFLDTRDEALQHLKGLDETLNLSLPTR